ncbi:MoaD/ThiS family protein [Acinetobacter baumannii]|uniref:MoaD/ThiS family protein n=1 Tax=Acinetobacter baumannii TaxID=470 RepID=UPI002447DAD3|nr:MoaD/ThiS family protein [Acinetobacter baumannii]MDH2630338.1 MoaD/ThiS family protein [Acinetobacter baumannii]
MQQSIQIKIEAFGAIEKLLPQNLSIVCPTNILVIDVLDQIVLLHPESTKAMEKCACAIGDNVITRQTVLSEPCTLVLLSPVAGG